MSIGAKNHLFRTAEGLHKRGHLQKLLTTYYSKKSSLLPKLREDSENISEQKVITNILPEVIQRTMRKIPKLNRWVSSSYIKGYIFDKWASKKLDDCHDCDVLVGAALYSLYTMKKAKEKNIITILESGSPNLKFKKSLLEDEYRKWGLDFKPDSSAIDKILQEYEIADFISILSSYSYNAFLKMGFSKDKLCVCPLGVDTSVFYPEKKKDNIFRIIHLGGSFRKGVLYLLEAVKQLRLPKSEFLWAGAIEPEIRPFLSRYNNYFRFIGRIPFYSQMPDFYRKGSLFVAPSISDGFGMVILEAMACGIPVICSEHTTGTDIVRNGVDGFVVPIRDVKAIKEKILFLYENEPERMEMSINARRRATQFTWERYGENISYICQQILKNKKALNLITDTS